MLPLFLIFMLIISVNAAVYCSAGYQYFEKTNACYGCSYNYLGYWKDAEENCQSENGHLASIHSQEELHFISTLPFFGYQEVWIGLSNANGTWQWNDGTQLNFQRWESLPPTDNNSQKCVTLMKGKFHQRECEFIDISTINYTFSVCKKDP